MEIIDGIIFRADLYIFWEELMHLFESNPCPNMKFDQMICSDDWSMSLYNMFPANQWFFKLFYSMNQVPICTRLQNKTLSLAQCFSSCLESNSTTNSFSHNIKKQRCLNCQFIISKVESFVTNDKSIQFSGCVNDRNWASIHYTKVKMNCWVLQLKVSKGTIHC